MPTASATTALSRATISMPTPSITASSGATGVLKQWTIRAPPYTFLDGINNSGVIQGQIYDAGFVAEGFTATSGGLFNIVNYPGPLMTAIVGINDRGDLCGSYWQTFGINTAFVAFRREGR